VGRGRAQRGVKRQIADFVALRQAGLDVTAALTVGLGLAAATGPVAGQLVKLGIEPAGGELLVRLDLLAPFPPLPILWRLRNGLRAGLALRDFRPFLTRFCLV